jgi:hypothetical protein
MYKQCYIIHIIQTVLVFNVRFKNTETKPNGRIYAVCPELVHEVNTVGD